MAHNTQTPAPEKSFSESAFHLLLLIAERQRAFSALVTANETLTLPQYSGPLLSALSETVRKVQSQFPQVNENASTASTMKFRP
jgi:hypothetical protein